MRVECIVSLTVVSIETQVSKFFNPGEFLLTETLALEILSALRNR